MTTSRLSERRGRERVAAGSGTGGPWDEAWGQQVAAPPGSCRCCSDRQWLQCGRCSRLSPCGTKATGGPAALALDHRRAHTPPSEVRSRCGRPRPTGPAPARAGVGRRAAVGRCGRHRGPQAPDVACRPSEAHRCLRGERLCRVCVGHHPPVSGNPADPEQMATPASLPGGGKRRERSRPRILGCFDDVVCWLCVSDCKTFPSRYNARDFWGWFC